MPQAVAVRYARALADAATDSKAGADPKQVLTNLRTFSEMFGASSELRNVLLSPAVSNSKKRSVVKRLSDTLDFDRLVRNFLFILVDRRRADLLDEMADAFETALDERMGIVRAEVTSAAPLSDRQQTDVQEELSRVSGKQVRCDFSIDPELIGGVVARIGSTVYDGSVRSQLRLLRERLVAH